MLPSENISALYFFSNFLLIGWFMATICMENPNTKMLSTTRNLARSFIRSPIIMAHGPNKWWNDKKSKIWTHAIRNDMANIWLRRYMTVGRYELETRPQNPTKWNATPMTLNKRTANLTQPSPLLSLGLVNSNSNKPLSQTWNNRSTMG